ncbi:ppGpp synthetase/RelA/SpoT-type nucleotidyltransferase [Dysgonomonas hofstadii]|uniref:PpGpp synthetase/RelA/SpoT-type nucleotidyltransferase n=1 Tax=Dysgonomonas hofstadii TaxID=637886 RepID=A0A840CYC8_9BACT|nr:RelA/SpoT family protein [Dysgonomonas hofstadii]MBB4037755.1 ppGpp synthetase/RelA/SpoT-type nucleotidyltransferase [Dysgonomonas hofstadii]
MIYEGLILIEQNLKTIIESNLARTGLLYRIYSRIKEKNSIEEKIIRKGYKKNGKLVQDLIGLRVMTYFNEDIEVLVDYFSSIFRVIDLHHDSPKVNQFEPFMINIVCQLEGELLKEFNTWKNTYSDSFRYIDSTFEIQVRTTLSEGWHEIEHNMRYKCKDEWTSLEDKSRLLNGIYASLEISDRTLFTLFEDIAYQHYKSKNWAGMLRNKFRLRFELESLSPEIAFVFDKNTELAKQFLKLERNSVLSNLVSYQLAINITFDNIVFLCNYLFFKDEKLEAQTPSDLIKHFNEAFGINQN